MGRHSSPENVHYYRSLMGWFFPWVLVAVVAAVAVWIAVDALGGPDVGAAANKGGPGSGSRIAATPTTTPSHRRRPSHSPTPKPSPKPRPSHSPASTPSPTATPAPAAPLITEGVTAQVLNGTSSPSADDDMARRLGDLGYQIVAVRPASRTYEATTVFWSYPSSQSAAEALARHFGWVAQPKPANLSPTVAIHVVVGVDEAT